MIAGSVDTLKRAPSWSLSGGAVGIGVLIVEFAIIVLISIATGVTWHFTVYDTAGDIKAYVSVGAITGLFYTLPTIFRSDYHVDRLQVSTRSVLKVVNLWTYAFVCLGALAFLTKTTGAASRGWLALFYVLGACGMVASKVLTRRVVRVMVSHEMVAPRRLLLIGNQAQVTEFITRNSRPELGLRIVSTAILPKADAASTPNDVKLTIEAIIGNAVESARRLEAHEILILSGPTTSTATMTAIADRFLDLPVGVHLGRLAFTDMFPEVQVSQLGTQRTLAVRKAPLSSYQLALKRIIDVCAASIGLVLLVPAFIVVSVLLKLDSKGPVFFRQRRRGFNQREFSIWKFRTMSTLDDGDVVEQAKRNDPRITRVGAFLRRYNIDELPQLINVIKGDMSLVGPRPHAVAHDRHYERIIKRYQRRLNVKPGITGWAQVNGYRGQTETNHAMRSRIAHDLYYIDHWSIAFDLYIIGMTVMSPKAFNNAH